MKIPLTDTLLAEAAAFELRSACRHCVFFREATQRCWHDWPEDGQNRWPLDAPEADGTRPTHVSFCKEFELR